MKTKKPIRFISAILATGSLLLSSMPVNAAIKPNLLIGDANRNGVIDIGDVTAIQRYLAEKITFDARTAVMAKTDFTHEDLTIEDTLPIQQRLAEFDTPAAREVGHTAFVWSRSKYIEVQPQCQSFMTQQLSNKNINCTALAVRNGRVLAQAAYGTVDSEGNRAVSIDSQFFIGSISKQFCATAILILQDQGKLSVNDDLTKFFPEYSNGNNLTLHHLLAQRSGIRNYNGIPQDLLQDDFEADKQTIKNWLFSQKLMFTPGQSFTYCNSNFFLLACVVEQVTGESYSTFLNKNLFAPLGMTHTGVYIDLWNSPDLVKPVSCTLPDAKMSAPLFGAGDIISNALDMDKWMTAVEEGTLLSAESHRAMLTDYSPKQYSPDTGYGYGIFIGENGTIGHNGRVNSYESSEVIDLAEHLRIFYVSSDSPSPGVIDSMAYAMAKEINQY